MKTQLLAELEFDNILAETAPQTSTGSDLINRYRVHLMNNESTFRLVNDFIREARNYTYDNGVNHILSRVSDYISENKISWALASTCESIYSNRSPYNYLNINAAKQVESLLEMKEDDVVKYIKAGAMKNVMFCESFRNIAKQVYKNTPIVESNAEYTVIHPVSVVESSGDIMFFHVGGSIYSIGPDKMISEASWDDVSNTFKTMTALLESKYASADENSISIKYGNYEYIISEADKCTVRSSKQDREMNVAQLRENNKLVLMATNPRFKNESMKVLESVAILCENYNSICSLDNTSIYSTAHDRFAVIESNGTMYATLLGSDRCAKWTINENTVDALSFIKSKTNVSLNEAYADSIQTCVENISESDKVRIEEEMKDQTVSSYRERIANLTEKFKNDPVKLAILSKLASDVSKL